jgi:hypothetical protein
MEVGTGDSTVTIESNLARVTFLPAKLLTNEVCEQGTEFRTDVTYLSWLRMAICPNRINTQITLV